MTTIRTGTDVAKIMTVDAYSSLMFSIARYWACHDAPAAAACFHEEVHYAEGPGRPVIEGRTALLAHFERLRAFEMLEMKWLDLSFDEDRQDGTGTFVFCWRGGSIAGRVDVEFEGLVVKRWSEKLEPVQYHSH